MIEFLLLTSALLLGAQKNGQPQTRATISKVSTFLESFARGLEIQD